MDEKEMKFVTGFTNTVRFDPVQRPAHYASGGIECADAIEAALEGETDPVVAWARGNAMKYNWRTGKKDDPVQDIEKGIWYLRRAIQRIQKVRARADSEGRPHA